MRFAHTRWLNRINLRMVVGSLALFTFDVCNGRASADEGANAKGQLTANSDTAGLTDNDFSRWIGDLDKASFATRRLASQQLEGAGIRAYEQLADAAIQRNREAAYRALEILERGLRAADGEEKTAAKKAVQRIAASSNQSAARAAEELLRDVERPRPSFPIALMNGWAQPIRPPIIQLGARAVLPGLPVIGVPPRAAGGAPINPFGPNLPGNALPLPNALPGQPAPRQAIGDRQIMTMLDDSIARLREQMSRTSDPARLEILRSQIQRSEDLKQVYQNRAQPPVR